MKERHERRRVILGLMIGNMFERPIPLSQSNGVYRVGSEEVSPQQIRMWKKHGYLDGLELTQKAVLWYQDSLRDIEAH